MKDLEMSPKELLEERQRLHDLIQKKNKVELAGVEEMLKHPYTWEQMLKQKEEMEQQFQKGEEARRRRTL